MRYPRHVKIFRGQIDAAPLAGVFFLLLIFLLLASLIYTPGVPVQISSNAGIELPSAQNMANTSGPTAVVAVNAGGQFFFENQIITRDKLKLRLAEISGQTREPLTLVILADKSVQFDVVVQLAQLAEDAGIKKALYQIRPPSEKKSR